MRSLMAALGVVVLVGIFAYMLFAPEIGLGATIFQVVQGGTGRASFTSSELIYGNGTAPLSSVATTSVSCSGSTSCTSFTAIGPAPITISSTASAPGLASSTPWTPGFSVYVKDNATLASVATTSVSSGTGISFTGTPGALIGGTNLTITNSGVTSNVAGDGIAVSAATGAVTISQTSKYRISTSSLAIPQVVYVTGVSPTVFSSAATGTVSSGTGISVTAGQSVIGSGLTITNAGVTSLAATSPILVDAATGAVTVSCPTCSTGGSSFGQTWELITNIFGQSALAPTTTQNIHVSGTGTSTFVGGVEAWRQIGAPYFNATSTTATSTFAGGMLGRYLRLSLAPTFDTLTSAIILTDANGTTGEYAGTTCTNQFVRALSALGVATCNSVSLTTDVTGTLPVANGGTGTTTVGQNQVLYGGSNNIYQSVSTSSVTAGSGITFTGTAGALVGGTSLTISANDANRIATTSDIAVPNLAYFTKTSGVTTLGSVATTTASCSGSASCTAFTVLGSSPITISATPGTSPFEIATTSDIAVPQVAYFTKTSGRTTLGSVATTSVTCAGSASCTSFSVFGASPITLTGTGLTAYDAFTHPGAGFSATTSSFIVGTSTSGIFGFTSASSTAPQVALSAGAGVLQWVLRNAGGNLYFSTTTVDGTSTTTISGLEISGSGFGTTTVRGLNISGFATTTSNVGMSITSGCYAIGTTCIGSSGGGTPGGTGTELQYRAGASTFGAVTNSAFDATGGVVGLGTTTPRWALTIASSTGPQLALVDGSLTSSPWTFRSINGNLYLATSSPTTFATSSVPLLTLSSISTVGVGTTSPYAAFSVASTFGKSMSLAVSTSTQSLFLVDDKGRTSINGGINTGYRLFVDATGGFDNSYDFAYFKANRGLDYSFDLENQDSGGTLTYSMRVGSSDLMMRLSDLGTGGDNGRFDFMGEGAARMSLLTTGFLGIATTTPNYQLTIASTTGPQLSLSGGAGFSQWTMRSVNGNFYFATSSIAGTATSSFPALTVIPGGISGLFGFGGTTTPSATITVANGQIQGCESRPATSTSMTLNWLSVCNQVLLQMGTSAYTITFSNVLPGATLRVITCNPGAGTPGAISFVTPIKWTGGTKPTQTTTVNQCDQYFFNGTFSTSSTATTIYGSAGTGYQ